MADGQAVFGAADPLQGKADGLGRTAAVFAGSAVPEGEQDVAVRGNIDPRLAVGVVAEIPLRRHLFAPRRHKDLLRPGTVLFQTPHALRAEVLLIFLQRERQCRKQRNAELL